MKLLEDKQLCLELQERPAFLHCRRYMLVPIDYLLVWKFFFFLKWTCLENFAAKILITSRWHLCWCSIHQVNLLLHVWVPCSLVWSWRVVRIAWPFTSRCYQSDSDGSGMVWSRDFSIFCMYFRLLHVFSSQILQFLHVLLHVFSSQILFSMYASYLSYLLRSKEKK